MGRKSKPCGSFMKFVWHRNWPSRVSWLQGSALWKCNSCPASFLFLFCIGFITHQPIIYSIYYIQLFFWLQKPLCGISLSAKWAIKLCCSKNLPLRQGSLAGAPWHFGMLQTCKLQRVAEAMTGQMEMAGVRSHSSSRHLVRTRDFAWKPMKTLHLVMSVATTPVVRFGDRSPPRTWCDAPKWCSFFFPRSRENNLFLISFDQRCPVFSVPEA